MVERLTVRRRTARDTPRKRVGFLQCSHGNTDADVNEAAGQGVEVGPDEAGNEGIAWGTDI